MSASDRPSRPSVPGEPRSCPRCAELVPCVRHETDHTVTWIWRCACGWGSARADSGVVSRARVYAATGGSSPGGPADDETELAIARASGGDEDEH